MFEDVYQMTDDERDNPGKLSLKSTFTLSRHVSEFWVAGGFELLMATIENYFRYISINHHDATQRTEATPCCKIACTKSTKKYPYKVKILC